MVPFEFTRLNEEFLEFLGHSILNGDSVVLAGPRNSGKRTTLKTIKRRLADSANYAISLLILDPESPPVSEADLCRKLLESLPEKYQYPRALSFSSLEKLFQEMLDPLVLMVSNVDAMSQPIAQSFLRLIEAKVEEGRIVALLTGESDIRSIIGGIRREFRIAQQYFLQGLSKPEFARGLHQLVDSDGITLANIDEFLPTLYDCTGGNIHLAQLVLKHLGSSEGVSAAQSPQQHANGVVSANHLENAIEETAKRGSWRDSVVRSALLPVIHDPSCCLQFEELVQQGRVTVDGEEALWEPTTLEWAGLANREMNSAASSSAGICLYASSPLMVKLVRKYLDDIRLGDLCAEAGEWERAFERYQRVPIEERIRPRDLYDRTSTQNVVRALCANFHIRATSADATKDVDGLFAKACQYLLGFREISVFAWRYDEQMKPGWHIVISALSDSDSDVIRQSIPNGDRLPNGMFEIPKCNGYTLGIALQEPNPQERTAVIVSDFVNRTLISPIRRKLLHQVIEHYTKAREHAARIESDRRRACVLEQYRDIDRFIGRKLREQRMEVNEVLDFVADRIIQLGYSTFACGYYYKLEERVICGVYRCAPKHVAHNGPGWPSEEVEREQLLAAQDGKPRAVLDVDGSEMWILPLRLPQSGRSENEGLSSSETTHTFMIQRVDGAPLTAEEISDLTIFGDQLLEAVHQSERIIRLQSSLNRISEPVSIIDADFRVRYANAAMRKLFHAAPEGWQESQDAPNVRHVFDGPASERLMELLNESLRDTPLTEQVLAGLGSNDVFYGRINTGSIHNSRRRVIGSYAHVQDYSDQHFLLDAIRLLFNAQTEDVLRALLLNIDRGKDAWRRFYRLDPKNWDVLIGVDAVGSPPEELKPFLQGRIRVTKLTETKSAWLCFEREAPVLFRYTSELGGRTKYGVPIEAVRAPPWTGLLEKRPQEIWLDVPLKGREPIGKLSMHANDEVRPEQIECWRVLGEAAGLAVENLERASQGRHTAALAAERVFLAAMGHNIHTRIASLFPVKYRYELYAARNPSAKIHEINRQFAEVLVQLEEVTERVKRQLGALRVQLSLFDLHSSIEKLLAQRGLAGSSRVECESETLMLEADRELIEGLLSELLQNSLDAATNPSKLEVAIRLENFYSEGKRWVRVRYSDNGPGVPAEMKLQIFDLFFTHRTNGTTGTGIGLYFAQRIILAHGGSIAETGQYGTGARFTIEIPESQTLERS